MLGQGNTGIGVLRCVRTTPVRDHVADELRAVLGEAGERVVDVVHGEHDAEIARGLMTAVWLCRRPVTARDRRASWRPAAQWMLVAPRPGACATPPRIDP